MGPNQPGLTLPQIDIGLGELGIALTQALDLPALEGQSGLETVFDEIVVARSPIDGDRIAGRCFCLFLAHEILAEALVCERIIRAKRCMARAFV